MPANPAQYQNHKNQSLIISEAANLLGVSTKTLRRWDKKGILPSLRTKGGQRRYYKESLLKFNARRNLTKAFIREKQIKQPIISRPVPEVKTFSSPFFPKFANAVILSLITLFFIFILLIDIFPESMVFFQNKPFKTGFFRNLFKKSEKGDYALNVDPEKETKPEIQQSEPEVFYSGDYCYTADPLNLKQLFADKANIKIAEIDDLTVNNSATIKDNLYVTNNLKVGGISSHLIPSKDDSYNLGSSDYEWQDLFINGTAHIDMLDMAKDIVMSDDHWVGLGLTKGRIEFDDQTSDEINILNANVGIGTQTPVSLLSVGSGSEFQVNGSGDIIKIKNLTYSWPSSHTVNGILSNDGSGGLTWSTIGAAAVTPDSLDFTEFVDAMTLDASTSINIYDGAADRDFRFYNSDSSDELLFLDGSTGNVGIGTINPSEELHIYSSANEFVGSLIETASTGNTAMVYSQLTTPETQLALTLYGENVVGNIITGIARSKTALLSQATGGSGMLFNVVDSVPIYFATNNTERMRITGAGDVGIGETVPGATLDVNGNLILQAGTSINEFSIDGTLAGDSDSALPTEKAVKLYVDTEVASGVAGKDTFIELNDTPVGYTTNGAIYIADNTGSQVDESTVILTEAANTFAITKGSASLDIAAGADLNIDTGLQVTTNAGILAFSAASKTLTVEDTAIVSQDYSSDASVTFAGATLNNTGLHLLDTNASHDLIIAPGSDLTTTDKTLTLTTGNFDRTITLSGNPTLSDWFDQSVKTGASPTFAGLTVTNAINEFSIDGTLAGDSDSALPTEKAVKLYVDTEVASGVAGKDTFIELNDTPVGYTTNGAIYIADNTGSQVDESTVILTEAANTFAITKGSASLDIAAGAVLNIDTGLQVTTNAGILAFSAASKTLTVEDTAIVSQDYSSDASVTFAGATLNNTGLHLLDTNASHDLIIAPGSDLTTTDKTLTLTTGNFDRTITLSGNPTLSDWFDQSVKTGASPTFAGLTVTNAINEFSIDGTLAGDSDSALPTEKAVKLYVDTEVASGVAGKDTFIELNDTPVGYTTNGAIYIADNTGSQVDESTVILTEAANTFAITKGSASLDIAAGAVLNIDTGLQVTTNAGILAFSAASKTLTVEDTAIVSQDYSSDASVTFAGATLNNTGLHLLDTNASHDLIIAPGSDLTTTDKTLTLTTGNFDRTITLSGNPTLSDWFDQSVKTGASPTFAGLTVTNAINEFSIDGTLAGDSDSALPTEKAVKLYVDTEVASGVAGKDTFIELNDTPVGYTTNGAIYIADNTGSQVDESTVILTEAANTFAITKGSASLDIAAGAVLNIDTGLQVTTNAGILAFSAASKTLTVEDTAIVSQDYSSDASVTFAGATLNNTGLHLLDTNASHDLIIAPGSDLTTTDKTLTLTTGNFDRTITLSGNPTLSDWFDQSVKTGASPTFAGLTVTNAINEFSIDGTLAGDSDSALPTEKAVKLYVDTEVASGVAGKDTFIELNDTPVGYTTNGAIYIADNTGSQVDESTVILTEAANTFAITKGSASLDIAAGAVLNIDTGLQVTTNAGILAFSAASKTLTVEDTAIVSQDYSSDASVTFAGATLNNTGLHLLDTNASHDLIIAPGSDLTTTDKTLTLTTGNFDRTITLSGNPTLSDWFDQSVKTGASPTFAGLTVTNAINEFSIDGTLAGDSDSALPTEKAVKLYVDTEVASGVAGKDTFIELNDTPVGYTTNGAIYIADNTGSQVDESTVILTEAANTFAITKGSASLDIAAGAVLNIDTGLQVTTNAGILAFSAASKTLTVEDTAIVSQDYSSDASVTFAGATLNNTGLHLLDTNASHDLIIAPGSDLTTTDKTLTLTTGNFDRTITLSGNPTLSDWFDQSVKTGASPTFAGLALGSGNITMTGSLATTGSRVTKGWFTNIESTNMPIVSGTAIDSTFLKLDASNDPLTGQLAITSSDAGLIDLNPSSTATQNVIDITPSAAIAAGATWKGAFIDGAALDPLTGITTSIRGFEADFSGVLSADLNDAQTFGTYIQLPTGDTSASTAHYYAPTEMTVAGSQTGFYSYSALALSTTATYKGTWIDWDAITTDANAPVLQGVTVDMPANYTGFGTSYAGKFSGDGRTVTLADTTYAIDVSGDVRVTGNTSLGDGSTADYAYFNTTGDLVFYGADTNLTWNTDGGGDIGAVGDNRPDHIYAKTDVVIGGTLTLSDTGITDSNSDIDFTSTTEGFNFIFTDGGAGDDFIVDGTTLVVESDNDNVGIGNATPLGKLMIDGSADDEQLYIQAHSSQNESIMLIEQSGGADLLTIDNSGNLIIEGSIADLTETTLTINDDLKVSGDDIQDSGDNITISFDGSGGIDALGDLTGSGRKSRTLNLNAEYSGAVLTAFYGANTDTSITGTLTADIEANATDLQRTYYQWVSTEAALHYYTVAIRITLPQDFSAWQTDNALQVDYVTENATNTNNLLSVYVYLESDVTTAVASDLTNASAADTWETITIDDSVINGGTAWNTAGQTAVIYLRMGSKTDACQWLSCKSWGYNIELFE